MSTMPDNRPSTRSDARTNTDEATIAAEERLQDEETAREAREEAEKLEAVPYERLKHEDDGGPEGSG